MSHFGNVMSASFSGHPGRREHIENRTGGCGGLHKTLLYGACDKCLQLAKISDLCANFAEMGCRQGLNLGARCPAGFAQAEQVTNFAKAKP